MLSTKHDDSVTTYLKKGKACSKPAVVLDYNKGKTFIDLSDQMAAYAPYCRRTVKWYKRLLFHLITATSVVNALYLFNKVNKKKINITRFKEFMVSALVGSTDNSDIALVARPSTFRVSNPKTNSHIKRSGGSKESDQEEM